MILTPALGLGSPTRAYHGDGGRVEGWVRQPVDVAANVDHLTADTGGWGLTDSSIGQKVHRCRATPGSGYRGIQANDHALIRLPTPVGRAS